MRIIRCKWPMLVPITLYIIGSQFCCPIDSASNFIFVHPLTIASFLFSLGRTLVLVCKISIRLLEIVLVLILWCLGYLSEKQVFWHWRLAKRYHLCQAIFGSINSSLDNTYIFNYPSGQSSWELQTSKQNFQCWFSTSMLLLTAVPTLEIRIPLLLFT